MLARTFPTPSSFVKLSRVVYSVFVSCIVSRAPGEAALSEAIQNVKKHYAVIGLVEMYPQFIQTLEVLFPTYFKGITAIYNVLGKCHLAGRHHNVEPRPGFRKLN